MTIWELVPAKGLPRCAAISPGMKGRGLRCPRSTWEIEAIGSYDSASRHQLRFYLGHAGRVPLPTRRSRGDRPTRDSARSASAPYQLED